MSVRRYRTIVLASTVVAASLALISVDITSAAEPSRAEMWIASSLLYVKVRARKPTPPEHFTTSDIDLDRASTMYQQMCAFCHGAARGKPAPFAKTLSPRPPQFVIQPSQCPTWMDVYIIQHGIRWTGMPSFEGMPQEDIWHLALYVEGRNQPRDELNSMNKETK